MNKVRGRIDLDHFTPAPEPRKVFWLDYPPEYCEIGGEILEDFFVEGQINTHTRGFMCATCHSRYGYGIGPTRGQAYRKQADGRFLRIKG